MKHSLAGRLLREIAQRRGCIVAPLLGEWRRELELLRETRARTALLLTDAAALHILICARAARAVPGAYAEAGVFKGGSARLICEEKGAAALHLFDVFELLQRNATPSGEIVRNHFGAVHGRLGDVRRLLASFPNVHFHPGLFPETAPEVSELRFSFVHLDLDLPEATQAALEFFYPRLAIGGILIGDDYSDPQVRTCFDQWFADRDDTVVELPWSQVMIVRQAAETSSRR